MLTETEKGRKMKTTELMLLDRFQFISFIADTNYCSFRPTIKPYCSKVELQRRHSYESRSPETQS